MALTTKASLVKRVGNESLLDQYADNDDDNITQAIAVAGAMFRSAAINRYTEGSVDALDDTTIDAEAKFHVESLSLDVLTAGGSGRPESIGLYADKAREWLRFLVAGKAHIDGLALVGSSAGHSGSGSVRWRAKAVEDDSRFTFDRSNTRSIQKDPDI